MYTYPLTCWLIAPQSSSYHSPKPSSSNFFPFIFFSCQTLPLSYALPLLVLTSSSSLLFLKKETILSHQRYRWVPFNDCLSWLIRERLNGCEVNLVCCFWMISMGGIKVCWTIKAASGPISAPYFFIRERKVTSREVKFAEASEILYRYFKVLDLKAGGEMRSAYHLELFRSLCSRMLSNIHDGVKPIVHMPR